MFSIYFYAVINTFTALRVLVKTSATKAFTSLAIPLSSNFVQWLLGPALYLSQQLRVGPNLQGGGGEGSSKGCRRDEEKAPSL